MGFRLRAFARTKKAVDRRDSPARVLIVDDEEPMRAFVERVLREAGYETATASDGDQAIALAAREAPFDLLVTDEVMPRMAGHQLARYMRERFLDIRVLYLTGFRNSVFKAKGSLWADEAFLDKPCTPDGLREAASLLLFGTLLARDPQRAKVLTRHPGDV